MFLDKARRYWTTSVRLGHSRLSDNHWPERCGKIHVIEMSYGLRTFAHAAATGKGYDEELICSAKLCA